MYSNQTLEYVAAICLTDGTLFVEQVCKGLEYINTDKMASALLGSIEDSAYYILIKIVSSSPSGWTFDIGRMRSLT